MTFPGHLSRISHFENKRYKHTQPAKNKHFDQRIQTQLHEHHVESTPPRESKVLSRLKHKIKRRQAEENIYQMWKMLDKIFRQLDTRKYIK